MPAYPRHLRDFPYTGFHRYFLTFCTYRRATHFTTEAAVSLAASEFQHAAEREELAILAYCFMPDHVHLLTHGVHADADLKRFVTRSKQCSGYRFAQTTGQHLWQRYGFERVLRDDESTPAIIRYIVNNPVRAGLVRDPADYPFWGSFTHTREALLEYIARAG